MRRVVSRHAAGMAEDFLKFLVLASAKFAISMHRGLGLPGRLGQELLNGR